MTTDTVTIRHATPGDADTITEHRLLMFKETRTVSPEIEANLRAELPDLLRSMLQSSLYVGWLAEADNGQIIAGAGVQVRRLLPRVETQIPCEALVVNVYVAPEFRRHGLARRLMEQIVAWAPGQGIERIALHASDMGRPLYASLGFAASTEMILHVKGDHDAG